MFLSRQRGAWDGAGEWDRTTDRRRVGPEACLSASYKGGQPPCTIPTKGAHPLRNPQVGGSILGHTKCGGRGILAYWRQKNSPPRVDRTRRFKRSLVWSRRVGSNHRPAVYETAALPTELRRPSMSCEETGWIGRGIDGIILSTSITCQSSDSIRRCHLTRASGRLRTWAFASSGGTLIGSCSCPYSALAALGTCVRT